jgi:hypothetical protein
MKQLFDQPVEIEAMEEKSRKGNWGCQMCWN